MSGTAETLFKEFAKSIGVDKLPTDENGGVQLKVGETASVILFSESANNIMVVSPVVALPKTLDYATQRWLLRRNFYDSPIAPFRISCDEAGTVVIWGRVPLPGLTAEALGDIVDAVATEADFIRSEIDVEVAVA